MNPSSTARTILFWISIVFLGIMLWKLVSTNGTSTSQDELSYSDFMAKVDADNVKPSDSLPLVEQLRGIRRI